MTLHPLKWCAEKLVKTIKIPDFFYTIFFQCVAITQILSCFEKVAVMAELYSYLSMNIVEKFRMRSGDPFEVFLRDLNLF